MSAAAPQPSESAPSSIERRLNTRLGKYLVTGLLGRGGMGVVYEAEDTVLRRRVAVKVLPSSVSSDPDAVERFLREARAAARLNHPNTVAVYDADNREGVSFLVMELVRGASAADRLRAAGAMAWPEATRIAAEACRGLAAAHAAGLIHRDIKPANIMLSTEGVVKLADFGLAKVADGADSSLSGSGAIGTPLYMSPEQCQARPVDARSDVYAMGATYFALLTGKPPYSADTPAQVMFAHCGQEIPDLRRLAPVVPATCPADFVRRAMAKSADERFADAEAMLVELENILADAPAGSLTPMAGRTMRRTAAVPAVASGRPAWWMLIAAGATAAILAVAIWLWPPSSVPDNRTPRDSTKDSVAKSEPKDPPLAKADPTPKVDPAPKTAAAPQVPSPEVPYLTHWSVLGYFEFDHEGRTPEQKWPDLAVDFGALYPIHGGLMRPWVPVSAKLNGEVSLPGSFGNRTQASAYGATVITAEADTEAVLWVEHDDGVRIRLNGEVVYDDAKSRTQPRPVAVKLKAGENVLTVRLLQDEGPWFYRIRLCGADGRRLAGVTDNSPKGQPPKKIWVSQNWVVLGRFDADYEKNTKPEDYPDAKPDFKAGYPAHGGQQAHWGTTDQRNSDGLVKLSASFDPKTPGMAYAATEFISDSEVDAVLWLTHDDGCRLRLNGETKYNVDAARVDWQPVPVHLRKGKNVLTLRVTQVDGEWTFRMKIAPYAERPVTMQSRTPALK